MKATWIPVGLCAFGVGFAVAWAVKPTADGGPGGDGAEVVPERNRQSLSSRAPSRPQKDYEPLFERMRENRYDSEGLEKDLDELGLSEIPEFLAALSAKAGLGGLSWEDEDLLEKTLKRWYQQNPEGAIAWVMALESEEDRRELLIDFVNLEAEEDLDGALALLDGFNQQVEGRMSIPSSLIQKGADRDVETMLRVCAAGLGESDGSSGSGLKYATDFDFEAALNGLVELEENAGEGRSLSSLPSNLLSEWAKRDPQAAFDWVQLGKELSFNSGLDEFIDGYAEIASDEEIGSFVAELFDPSMDERKRYDQAWDALSEVADEDAVRQFLTDVAPHGGESVHIEGLLERSMSTSGGGYDATRAILLNMMDSQSRYELFTSGGEKNRFHRSYMRDRLVPVLQRLGHTPAEISEMLPAKDEE